jgi:hypothetical protein
MSRGSEREPAAAALEVATGQILTQVPLWPVACLA